MAQAGTAKPKRKVRIGLIILAIILVLIIAFVIWLFLPDIPPRPWEPVFHKIGTLFAKEHHAPSLTEAQWQQVEAKAIADGLILKPATDPLTEKANEVYTQLTIANIPVDAVSVLMTKSEQSVLTVTLNFDELLQTLGASESVDEAFGALKQIANNKAIDLSGMHDVDIAIHDSQNRLLLTISAPAASIQQYRDGTITQLEMMQTVGARGHSRVGILDAARKAGLSR